MNFYTNSVPVSLTFSFLTLLSKISTGRLPNRRIGKKQQNFQKLTSCILSLTLARAYVHTHIKVRLMVF